MKIRFLSLLAILSAFAPVSASALVVSNVAAPSSNCDGGTWNVDFYGNFQGHLWDRYNANSESYVSGNSRVDVYVNGGKVNIPDGWVQPTSYAPSAGQYYVAWNNALAGLNLANLVPSDRGNRVAQVSYSIRRAVRNDSGTVVNGSYFYAPFVPNVVNITDRGNL